MTRLSPSDAYRLWAPTWDGSASPIVELERRYLIPWLENLGGKTFVDIGCGTGRWMTTAFQSGARTFGVDLSFEMLQQAVAKPGLHGHLAVADMCHLPLSDGFADIVLCALSLGHCRETTSAFAELLRLARPGGRVMISDFHPDAVRRGWKRTFQHGVDTFEVESFAYSIDDLITQAHTVGFKVEQLLELNFGAPEERIFMAAERADLFARVEGHPAVVLLCLRKL